MKASLSQLCQQLLHRPLQARHQAVCLHLPQSQRVLQPVGCFSRFLPQPHLHVEIKAILLQGYPIYIPFHYSTRLLVLNARLSKRLVTYR